MMSLSRVLLCVAVCVVGLHAVSSLSVEDWDRVLPAEPAIFLQEGKPFITDPASEAAFRNAPKSVKPIADNTPPFTWKDKAKYIAAYKVQAVATLGQHTPEVSRASQQAVDPSTVHRECPRRSCPSYAKCADATMTCCGTGNFTFCCPTGTTCLTTSPPTCIKESPKDPEACTEQECLPDHHCPLSKVSSCCFGGKMCCPYSGKCTADYPPKCRVLSRFELMNKRQPPPSKVVKSPLSKSANGTLVANDVPFARAPFKVVPKVAPTVKKPVAQKKEKQVVKKIVIEKPSTPVKPAPIALFPTPPTEPGTRSRQRSQIVNGTRVTTTETQITKRMSDGGLKTTTRIHKEVTELPKAGKASSLWGNKDIDKTIAKGLDRLRKSKDAHSGQYVVKHKKKTKKTTTTPKKK